MIYPEKGRFTGPDGQEESTKWASTHDFVVLQRPGNSWCMGRSQGEGNRPPLWADGLSLEPRAGEKSFLSRDPFWYIILHRLSSISLDGVAEPH